MKWLRYGIATASVIGLACAGTLAACGDDDSGATGTPDAGKDNNVTPVDSGGTDSGGTDSGGDSGKIEPAKIIVVHATTSYGADMMGSNTSGSVRVCYATKTASDSDYTMSPLAPLPDTVEDGGASPYPGIPIGAGGPFPSTGLPLEGISIRPFVIDAQYLANLGVTGNAATLPRCNKLLPSTGVFVPDGGFPDGGSDAGLERDKQYWQLADIPAGTFKNGHTYVLAITGCAGDAPLADTNGGLGCGGGFTPDGGPSPGNLTVIVSEIDSTTTVAADELGAQVMHLSPQYDFAHDTAAPTAVPAFDPVVGNADAGDAGLFHVSADGGSQPLAYSATGKATVLAKVKGLVTASGYFAANESDPTSLTGAPMIPIPLNNTGGTPPATVQYLSEGHLAPTAANLYVNGKTYTFFLVGDPLRGTSDLRKVHYLGFPNVFTPPPAQ